MNTTWAMNLARGPTQTGARLRNLARSPIADQLRQDPLVVLVTPPLREPYPSCWSSQFSSRTVPEGSPAISGINLRSPHRPLQCLVDMGALESGIQFLRLFA